MKKTNKTNKVISYTSIVDSANKNCNNDLNNIKCRENLLKSKLTVLEQEEKAVKYGFQNKAHNLEQYSTFKVEQICPFMADIIGLSCGEEYTWEFLNYNIVSNSQTLHYSDINKIIFHPTNKNPLTDTIANNQMFIMPYNKFKNEITFFKTVVDLKSNTSGLKLTRTDILEKLPLLGIFIDMVVESRLVDKLNKVTDNELKRVQGYFLTLYKDELKSQYMQSKTKKLK